MSDRILIIEPCTPDTPVPSSDDACGWGCVASELRPITEGVLRPGEPVPAGDCPKCGCDAFPIRAADRVRAKARVFAAVAVEIIFGEGTDRSTQRAIDLSREAFQAAAITRGVAESLDLHPQPAEAA